MEASTRRWAAAGALAAALFGLWRLDAPQWPRYRRLQDGGALAQGWVTAKDPAGQLVYYSFSAAGRVYDGIGTAGFGNPEFDALGIKDALIVTYSASDPGDSILGLARERLRAQNFAIALVLTIAAPIILWALWRELQKAE